MKIHNVNLYKRKTYHNDNKRLVQSLTKPKQYTQKTKHLSGSGMTSEEQQKIKYLENLHNEIVLTGVLPDTGRELKKEQAMIVAVPSDTVANCTELRLYPAEKQSGGVIIVDIKEDTDINQVAQKIISEYNDKTADKIITTEDIKLG